MANNLPEFLQFTRKPRRTMEARTGEDLGVAGDVSNDSDGGAVLTDPKRIAPAVPAFDPALAEAPAPPASVEPTAKLEVSGAERRTLGPAPLPHNAKGEAVGSPEYDDTGAPAVDLENYRRGLEGQRNPEDRDGRVKSGVKTAARMFLDTLTHGGSVGAGIRNAVVGGAYGAAVPNANERAGRDREIRRVEREQSRVQANQKAGLEAEGERASTRQKNAQASYYEQRPDIEAAKRTDAQAKAEQSRVFRVLSSLKGQKLYPADPRVRQLQADADRAGIPFDVESFNNSKGNVVRYVRTDPDRPEQTVEVERNVLTGAEQVLGQKGYQATRDASGMTTAEVKTDEDRDRGYNALERERVVQHDLRRAGLAIAKGNLTLAGQRFDLSQAQFDNRLGEQTRKELKGANDLIAESERYQESANAIGSRTQYKDPETGEMKESRKAQNQRDLFQARAESLRRRALANYGYLFSPDEGGVPHMSAEQLQQMFPSVGGNWSGLAERLGVRLTDTGSGQGPVRPSAVPRRGAPRAASQSAPAASAPQPDASGKFSEADVRAYAQATGKGHNADKAVEELRRQGRLR